VDENGVRGRLEDGKYISTTLQKFIKLVLQEVLHMKDENRRVGRREGRDL
jgi:hypothetical protein